jgi:hypothetical protein
MELGSFRGIKETVTLDRTEVTKSRYYGLLISRRFSKLFFVFDAEEDGKKERNKDFGFKTEGLQNPRSPTNGKAIREKFSLAAEHLHFANS